MRNTHKIFEEELKRRLWHYSEEPKRDLWAGIGARLVLMEPKWTFWVRRLSTFIIVASGTFFLAENSTRPTDFKAEVSAGSRDTFVDTVAAKTTLSAGSSYSTHVENRAQSTRITQVTPNGVYEELLAVPTPIQPQIFISEVMADMPGWVTSRLNGAAGYSDGDSSGVGISERRARPNVVSRKNKGGSRKMRPRTFYFAAMPTLGYQRIEPNHKDHVVIESIRSVRAFSSDRLGFRLEAGTVGPIGKRWNAFGSILYYYQRRQTIHFVERRLDSLAVSVSPRGAPTFAPSFGYFAGSMEFEVKNIGIHFGVSYGLWKNNRPPDNSKLSSFESTPMNASKRFVHEAGGGLELHSALHNSRVNSDEEAFRNSPIYAFLSIYYRVQYPDRGRLRATLQPTFLYSFYINSDNEAPFYVKPYGFGLNLGCMYRF